MSLVATELFLKGILTPFLVAALVVGASNLRSKQHIPSFAQAYAIAFAIVVAGLLAFGWPIGGALTARTKILVSATIGLGLGASFEQGVTGSRLLCVLGLIGITIWIGEPAFRQNRWEDALPLIPLFIGFILLAPPRYSFETNGEMKLLTTLVFAFGLAALAAFAKSLSYSLLASALASALLAIVIIGRSRFTTSAIISADATLWALITALLLYTEVSLPALLILCLIIGVDRLAHLTWRHASPPPRHHLLVSCIALALVAILIARIDGGAISIY